MMANVDELNKAIAAYAKYVSDKQRHDNTVFNLTQKRVRIFWLVKNISIKGKIRK